MEKMDQKWKSMKAFIDDVIERPEKYPDKLVVFTLSDEELSKVFTRERLKILRTISRVAVPSVKDLANTLHRDMAAVHRDLVLLQKCSLVKLKREGQRVRPIIDKEGIFLPLMEPKPITALEK